MKTQAIKREILAEFYKTVCDNWKKTIADLILFDTKETIQVSNQLIEKAYKEADSTQKKLLKQHFNLAFLNLPEICDTLEAVYKKLKVNRNDVIPYPSPTNKRQRHLNASVDIEHISKMFNNGKDIKHNGKQTLYTPYFRRDSGRWVVYYYYYWFDDAVTGSGNYYLKPDNAIKAGELFEDIYNDYLPEQ